MVLIQYLLHTVVDPCLSDPCQNSGDCATVEDSNQCNCGSGFSGMNCEVGELCWDSTLY